MLDGIPVYNLVINEKDEEDGVSMMSIVDKPAVEKDFLKFNTQKSNIAEKKSFKYSLNEEKRIITGVALRADYPIYRKEGEKEFYINMDASTIEKIVQKFMREKRLNEVNLLHEKEVDGVFLVESFLLNKNHKVSFQEFSDVSEGSWLVSYKVDNDDVWKYIKDGKLKGFSVELTGELKENQDFNNHKYREMYECINQLIKV